MLKVFARQIGASDFVAILFSMRSHSSLTMLPRTNGSNSVMLYAEALAFASMLEFRSPYTRIYMQKLSTLGPFVLWIFSGEHSIVVRSDPCKCFLALSLLR